jgi:cell division transport system ATP-binding protein
MIDLYHISKRYQGGPLALHDVSFHSDEGDFSLITGPSGSGKTTLLKLLYRAEFPSEGQIVIDNKNILKIPTHKIYLLRRDMGIVFQDFRLLFHKRVFENVAIALRVLGIQRKEVRRKVFYALRMVSLHHKMWEYPSRLSYGEQQRVAIARAIVNNPSILLADEPTGNLDFKLAFEIMKLFKEINDNGTTVIICTHDRELIRYFGDRVLFLYNGRLLRKETL